jgi:hypothetical protein
MYLQVHKKGKAKGGKMCQFAAPPGYRRTPAPIFPMLAALVAIIDATLEADTAKSM